MLQTNPGNAPIQMAVFHPAVSTAAAPVDPVIAPCRTTRKLLGLFEEITGWKAEFEESSSSLQRRKLSTSKTEPAQGVFSIVDMSEHWPAQKPTCHRGKCDQLIGLISELVDELQTSKTELGKIQSALVALDTTAEIDDDSLVDSFVPKFGLEPKSEIDSNESELVEPVTEFDDDFEVHQHEDVSSASLVCPPFEGWALGGATGIVGNFYVDWHVDGEERIAICAGEIDAETGDDREAVILVDPLTNEFRVVPGDNRDCSVKIQAFYLWDSKTASMSAIEPSSNWQRLKSHQSILTTFDTSVGEIECWQTALECDCEQPVGRLAQSISNVLGSTEPLLMLGRV